MMLAFQSRCYEKVRDRKLKYGPRQLKEGCYILYLELVLIFASLEGIIIIVIVLPNLPFLQTYMNS